jgi:hypothetical protein
VNWEPLLSVVRAGKVVPDADIPYGVHLDMPAELYHGLPGASASILKQFWGEGVTPAHAKVAIEEKKEPSDAMVKGTMVHGQILEPGQPLPAISIEPETYPAPAGHADVKAGKIAAGSPIKWNNNAKLCKEWRAAEEARGNTVLKRGDYDAVLGMVKAVAAHETAAPLFRDGKPEVSLIVRDEQTGLPIRCRLDLVPPGDYILDLKTTRAADRKQFTELAYELGYHIQMALYLDVWNALCAVEERKTCVKVVAVESAVPYCVNVFRCTDSFIDRGRRCYTRLLALLARCMATVDWPAYPQGEVDLEIARWKFTDDLD